MKRLLILSCSARKRADRACMPAIERYDGPAFQVLRKFLRSCPDRAHALHTLILSAEFGLMQADHPTPYYDRRMTHQRAIAMQPQVMAALARHVEAASPEQLFVSLGRAYWKALAGYEQLLPGGVQVTVASGSQGRRLAQLRDWLYGGAPPVAHPAPARPQGKARLRGVEVALTSAQVLDVARRALAERRGDPYNYQSWYVDVDGQRVAPKWLVSQVTGVPVSKFQAGEARRFLFCLGIQSVHV
jgi:hypothetical protein